MSRIDSLLQGVRTAAISGHINPDGDCIGSCLAMYCYIKDNYPMIDAAVYLQEPQPVFGFLKGTDEIRTAPDKEKHFDLLILLDISDINRVKEGSVLIPNSEKILCIDHHRTNTGFGCDYFFNEPDASSACEVLCTLMDPEKISYDCAKALYTGIVHDTGVFKFSCTSPRTMKIAGMLMSRGIPFTDIIEDTFYKKSYAQNVMMGRVVAHSELLFDGRAIIGCVPRRERFELGLSSKELDGIVNQLTNTKGVEVSAFLYEFDAGNEFKISLRSWKYVDVSAVCSVFGGGGHFHAAGCIIKGSLEEVKALLLPEIEKALKGQES